MLETSRDVLNIILAISVFSISFFIVWALYYLVMTLRQLFKTIESAKKRIDRVDEAIIAFKNKIESSSSYLLLLGEGVKKLVDIMKDREKRREKDEK